MRGLYFGETLQFGGQNVELALAKINEQRLDERFDSGNGGFKGGFMAEIAESLAGDGANGGERDV